MLMSLRFVAMLSLPMPMMGCTPVTQYVDRPIEVEIPVSVPCAVEIEPAPEYATQALTRESSDGDIIRALLVEREQRGVVEGQLRADLAGCVGPVSS